MQKSKNYSLSLCVIAKDEEINLPILWTSVKHIVDEFVVVDTGSKDATVEVAKNLGARVFPVGDRFCETLTKEHVRFFRKYGVKVKAGEKIFHFAKARNYSFQWATSDFILWLDSDDILCNSLKLKELMNENLDPVKQLGIHLLYRYEVDHYQNPIVEHYRERIVPNNKTFKWQGRIHEIIVPDLETQYIRVEPKDCYVLHNSSEERKAQSGERNAKALLLDLYEQGDNVDPRTLFFLAESLKIAGRLEQAQELYQKYVELSGWNEEKCLACVRLCSGYIKLNDYQSALKWAYRAIQEKPDFPMGYSALAQVYYALDEWGYAEKFAKDAINTNQPETLVMVDDKYNRFIPLYILAELYMQQGALEKALKFCQAAMEFEPQNETLLKIHYTASKMYQENELVKSIGEVVKYLKNSGEVEKGLKMLDCVPETMKDDPRILTMKGEVQGEMEKRSQEWVTREKRLQVGAPIDVQYKLLDQDLRRHQCQSVLLVSNEPLLAQGLKSAGYHVKRVVNYDKITQDYDAVFFDYNLHMMADREEFMEEGVKYAKKLIGLCVPNRDPEAVIACTPGMMETWLEPYRAWNVMPLRTGVIYASALLNVEKKEKVTFFCGGGSTEEWGPASHIDGGCGGSEEATIYLSRELAALGHEVEVINSFPHPCRVDGVRWRHVSTLGSTEEFETLILWRIPHYLDEFGLKAKRTFLWLHDVPEKYWFTKDRLEKIEKIIVLSKFHRGLLSDIPDEKFIISQNGVNVAQFAMNVARDPNKVIYTSSYDRGLEHLLKIWPDVRKECPHAELHIYYGWGTFDKLRTEEKQRKWKSEMMELMNSLPGVFEHGRVDQIQIAHEMCSANVYAYPCHFEEISCISAMKAQLAGCYPLTTDYSALAETNLTAYKVKGNPKRDKDTMKVFKDELVKALKFPINDEERAKIRKGAFQRFNWLNVAEEWAKHFTEGNNE